MNLSERFFSPSPKKIADKHLFPEETIRLVENRLSSLGAEIFQELRRVDKGRLGIPVYMSLYGVEGLRVTGKVKQMGKGASEELAKASALMELVERYSLFKKIQNGPFKKASLKELGEEAIPLKELLESVVDPEGDTVATKIAAKFLPQVSLYWERALEVSSGKERLVPIHWFWLLYEYNGSSAGNTLAEAGVQAVCELIERHVCALASRQNLILPEIDVSRVSEEARRLLACYERLGVKLYLRDMTLGMPAPTVAALAYDPSTYPHRSEIVYTAGTATSPERALIRALTEVAQLAGDFDTEGRYLESGLPKFETLEEAAPVLAKDGTVSLDALPNFSRPDHVEELKLLAEKLADQGFTLYLCDFTDKGLGLPAVYAILPGAHFRERLFLSPLYQLVRVLSLYLPPEEALLVLKAIEAEAPPRYYLSSYLGQILKTLGHHHEAIEMFQRAIALSPPPDDLMAIYCHLAHTYLTLEQYKAAQKVAEEGLSLRPSPELYNILGTACFKQGLTAQAFEAYMQALNLNPQSAQDYANAGACLASMGFIEEAEEFFASAQQLDPSLELEAYRRLARR